MTDLLASLVDRALERTPVLQRRQPTLFEPVAGAAFREQSKSENVASLEEQETVIERRPDSEGQKHFVSNASQVTPLSHQDTESQPVETRPPRRRRVHDASPQLQNDRDDVRPEPVFTSSIKEPAKAISHEELPSRELKPSAVAKPEEITVAPPRLIETIVERRVDREIIKEPSTEKPAIKEVHIGAQLDSQPKPSSDDDRSQQKQLKAEVKQLTLPKEQTSIKPLTQKKPVPRQAPLPIVRALSRAESKAPPKQPTPPMINVTIGRVEVRATPPTAARPRIAQPVGPKMSLEDYLRSRGKGN